MRRSSILPTMRLHHRMIDAHHGKAVERHVLDEIAERVLHRLERLEVIEMLRVDIGDDGDVGRQFQKRAVALVGFHHHPLAGAQPRIGAVGIDDAAIDHGRIEIAGIEQGRDHRGGRGLAVGARDRNAAFEPHQFGQHFGAAHHRNALGARRHQFRIVALDRGRDHDDVGAVDVLGLVADRDLDALFAQPRRRWRFRRRPSPARYSRDCTAPRQCRSCRCRRSRRNEWVRSRAAVSWFCLVFPSCPGLSRASTNLRRLHARRGWPGQARP